MKRLRTILLSILILAPFLNGCGNNTSQIKEESSSKKFAKADMKKRTEKLDKTLANLKNQKDIISTEKAALMTSDYENISGIEASTLEGKDFTQKDLSDKDMTIVYVWYTG